MKMNLANKPTVDVIGVPIDLGANIRGANMGPDALRIARLHEKIKNLGYPVNDLGNVPVPVRETIHGEQPERGKYLANIAETCGSLRKIIATSLKANHFPLTIGGDHCIAVGSVGAMLDHYAPGKLGLIWFDAHADLNTPTTSPSGNIHGMPLSIILGHGYAELKSIVSRPIDPKRVALIGIRTLDAEEKRICKESGIHYYTMREIDELGMAAVMQDALGKVAADVDGLYISLDLDSIDPQHAPGVSTPETGGLSYREIHLGLEMVADTGLLAGIEIVEHNPMCDVDHKTARLAVELVQSALGKAII